MKLVKNDVITDGKETVLRVLETGGDEIFVVDCNKKRMPFWMRKEDLSEYQQGELSEITDVADDIAISVMNKRYTMIAGILPVVEDEKFRAKAITEASNNYNISKQTIRNYVWIYLVAQDKKALAPEIKKEDKRDLSESDKNIR